MSAWRAHSARRASSFASVWHEAPVDVVRGADGVAMVEMAARLRLAVVAVEADRPHPKLEGERASFLEAMARVLTVGHCSGGVRACVDVVMLW
jgi:hypothetical protein